MRLILVRHGLPDYDKDCLKQEGKIQAEKCSCRLMDENICEIFSSPMGRAIETAKYTADKLNLKVQILDFISEIHGKRVGGLGMCMNGIVGDITSDIVSKGKPLNMDNILNGLYFKGDMFRYAVEDRQKGIDDFLRKKGFVRDGMYYNRENPAESENTVAVFAHCNAITAVLAHFFNIEMPLAAKIFRPDLTGITIINFAEKKGLICPTIEILNDSRHIDKIDFNLE